MDLYFEEYLEQENPLYSNGDMVCFLHNNELYFGMIENTTFCFHHNIRYILYVIIEEGTGENMLVEEDRIRNDFMHSFILLEMENNKYDLNNEIPEYKNFSFVIM